MNKWISVKEKLPKQNVNVLWFPKIGDQFTGKRDGYSINWGGDLNIPISNGEEGATHWMKLPPNPTGDK
jgi:hypothetical protein